MRTFIFKNTVLSASLSVDAEDIKAARNLVATVVADTADWAFQFDFEMEEGEDEPYEDAMDHLSEDDFEEEDWDDEDGLFRSVGYGLSRPRRLRRWNGVQLMTILERMSMRVFYAMCAFEALILGEPRQAWRILTAKSEEK